MNVGIRVCIYIYTYLYILWVVCCVMCALCVLCCVAGCVCVCVVSVRRALSTMVSVLCHVCCVVCVVCVVGVVGVVCVACCVVCVCCVLSECNVVCALCAAGVACVVMQLCACVCVCVGVGVGVCVCVRCGHDIWYVCCALGVLCVGLCVRALAVCVSFVSSRCAVEVHLHLMQVKRFAPLRVVGILGLLLADGILGLVLAVGIIGPLLAAGILGLHGRAQDVYGLLQLLNLFMEILLIKLLPGALQHLKLVLEPHRQLHIEVGHNLSNHCLIEERRLTGSRQLPRICFPGLDLPGRC